MSVNISKNLSYCYNKLDDIENTLCSLKSICLGDEDSMRQLLLKSAKNDKLEEFKWGLMRTNRLPILKEIINYLVYYQKITIEEDVKDILSKNRYFQHSDIEYLFN